MSRTGRPGYGYNLNQEVTDGGDEVSTERKRNKELWGCPASAGAEEDE